MPKKIKLHKDFHGAFSYGLQFLCENYGEEEMVAYLVRLARTVYRPLVDTVKLRGLPALEEHLIYVFTVEGGKFEIGYEEDVLVLRVEKCPAIHHMKERNYPIAQKYCDHCRILNQEICKAAGYSSSVKYDQDEGSCVQRFWEER
ncbi:MAG: hypothetical protein DRQ02_08650 [Candidatus Latescibacterota bacterium]|nr:MAG: hypothetical protein DRQ02_08650 [Candidatus Latescibacterota bacterium]RKY71104.1 MAG: hypothetical protein DRQ24_08080 [Candidatus Latescibacterota bacterium]